MRKVVILMPMSDEHVDQIVPSGTVYVQIITARGSIECVNAEISNVSNVDGNDT